MTNNLYSYIRQYSKQIYTRHEETNYVSKRSARFKDSYLLYQLSTEVNACFQIIQIITEFCLMTIV